jgi:hypothetical protein
MIIILTRNDRCMGPLSWVVYDPVPGAFFRRGRLCVQLPGPSAEGAKCVGRSAWGLMRVTSSQELSELTVGYDTLCAPERSY